jgi:beta-lactamase class A
LTASSGDPRLLVMADSRQVKTIRRATMAALIALLPLTGCGTTADASRTASATTASAERGFKALEGEYGARLGVWALDTGTGRTVTWRAGERFAYASTYKALAAGELLRRDPGGLDDVVTYTKADLVTYSPITEQHVDTGMTVRALCDAAIRYSDNTAGNLLLRRLGGPKGLQAALRRIGDHTIHADRFETALGDAVPGDVRDTSTPRALGTDLRRYAIGSVLPKSGRVLLDDWLRRNTTGTAMIRAGVPAGWTVGDKSGAADYGTRNDVAVVWPPHRAPIVLAILSTRTTQDAAYDDALIAAAARVTVGALGGQSLVGGGA